ncbi:MAG: hypothetical protein M0R48_02015 [Candidatus Omnitrophica bacterium]|jgi:hypothetical protein|nr:hypothetical protein [Candidatus Omnitrophota bacterium]
MKKKLFPILVSLVLVCVLLPVHCTMAEVPHLINYQGRLTDTGGVPLNGSYNLTFRIYDAETAGNLLWEETQTGVIINKGIFAVLLGSVANLNVAFDKPYFLEIKVGNEVMTPRQKMASAGYAIRADSAEKIKASDNDAVPGTLAAKAKNSIVVDNNQLQLSGDVVSPGNDKVYGTNSSGVKGWHERPSFQGMQVFTSSGTWVKPTGVNKVYVKVWGAGGGGSGGHHPAYGSGGGSGGYSEGVVNVVGDISVTIGSGGSGGRIGQNGSAGSNSSFGSDITATGGSGGSISCGIQSCSTNGGAGGNSNGGNLNLTGSAGSRRSQENPGQGIAPIKLGSYGNGGSGGWGGTQDSNQDLYTGDGGQNGLVIVYW